LIIEEKNKNLEGKRLSARWTGMICSTGWMQIMRKWNLFFTLAPEQIPQNLIRFALEAKYRLHQADLGKMYQLPNSTGVCIFSSHLWSW
jgi:hypothetical protein